MISAVGYTVDMQTNNHLAALIRDAIKRSGLSLLAISKRAAVPYSRVHEFVNDEGRDITMATGSKLCRALGLALRPTRRGKTKG